MQRFSSDLLDKVSFNLGALRTAKRMFAEQLAPDFSFFDYFRADEVALSACIAGLLNPNGTHGQGDVFLRAFFTYMVGKKDWVSDFKNCDVRTEQQTDRQRRIDIVLRFDDAIVGIENKPWAGDQNEQLSDYAKYLEKEAANNKRWLLIYLSDRDPSSGSLSLDLRKLYEMNGTFIQCSFAQLEAWLHVCGTEAKALQVRIFIEELHKFVRMRVKGELDMTEEKQTTEIILESQRHLEAAFDVFNAVEASKVQLLERLRQDLLTHLTATGFQLVWDDSFSKSWRPYLGFGVKFHANQDVYLRFEFQQSYRDGLIWGFKRSDSTVTHQLERWTKINECMQSFGRGGNPADENVWPWYSANSAAIFGENLPNWHQDARPWSLLLNISSGGPSVASRITKLAADIHTKLGNGASVLIANTKSVVSQ